MQDHQEWASFFFPNVKFIHIVIFKVLNFSFLISEFSGNRNPYGCKVPKLFTVSLEQESICFRLPSPRKAFWGNQEDFEVSNLFLKENNINSDDWIKLALMHAKAGNAPACYKNILNIWLKETTTT